MVHNGGNPIKLNSGLPYTPSSLCVGLHHLNPSQILGLAYLAGSGKTLTWFNSSTTEIGQPAGLRPGQNIIEAFKMFRFYLGDTVRISYGCAYHVGLSLDGSIGTRLRGFPKHSASAEIIKRYNRYSPREKGN
jgi:hypothetical protein